MLPAIAVITVAAAIVTGYAVWRSVRVGRPVFGYDDLPVFTTLLAVAALSAGLRFGSANRERVVFSFTGVVIVAAIPLLGPVGAVLLGVGAAVLDARQGWWQIVALNGAMLGFAASAASVAYELLGGLPVPSPELPPDAGMSPLLVQVGVPLVLSDVVLLATNLLVLLAVTRLEPQAPPAGVVARHALATAPTYLAWGVVGFLVVVLWGPGRLGPIGLFLVVAPLVVTRHIHAMFAAERLTRRRIIEALASTGAPDGSHAHTDRVMGYAMDVAEDMGIGVAQRASLASAVRLHDVGRRGRWATTGTGEGSADRVDAVRHAVAAESVIGRVDFLAETAGIVRHQAEWFDGSGGPDALAGGDIPAESRILAVADALAVLVGEGVPVTEALTILRDEAGRRFDPVVMEAAARVSVGSAGLDVSPVDAVAPPSGRRSVGYGRAQVFRRDRGHRAGAPTRSRPAGGVTAPVGSAAGEVGQEVDS